MYRRSETYRRTLLINKKLTQKRTAKENRRIKANRFFALLIHFFISAHSFIKFKFIGQFHYTTAPTRFATGFGLGSPKYRSGTGVVSAALVLDRYSILLLATRVIPKGCRVLPCPITSTCLYSGLDKICLSAGCVKPWDSLVTGVGTRLSQG